MPTSILCIVGPTASGKSSRAVEEALLRDGEIISVDSRQVYRELNIGTEKITKEEMRGVPHHLIDIRNPGESYSASNFAFDAATRIDEIAARGKLPILAGGTFFYLDALFNGLPLTTARNQPLRDELEKLPTLDLYARIKEKDPRRAGELDPQNRRRLIRALEIVSAIGLVPSRTRYSLSRPIGQYKEYEVEWIVIDPPAHELRKRIQARLIRAFGRGLVEEVRRIREQVGDERLNELGLEYKIVGEYLRGERTEESLLPALSAKLWHYARHQKAWLRKLDA